MDVLRAKVPLTTAPGTDIQVPWDMCTAPRPPKKEARIAVKRTMIRKECCGLRAVGQEVADVWPRCPHGLKCVVSGRKQHDLRHTMAKSAPHGG
jgi:queuine/archaeosine tRNA-ribosyltransferase